MSLCVQALGGVCTSEKMQLVSVCAHVCNVCMWTCSPGLAGWDDPTLPNAPCLARAFLLYTSYNQCVCVCVSSLLPSLPEKEQAMVQKPSNCL